MKRFMIAAVAVFVLLNLSFAYGQHGKGMSSSAAGMSHKPISAGKPSTSHTPQGGHLTPSQMLASKPKLSANLAKLLPDGTNMATVCDNFRNLGQCVAAVHVSHNLGLSFTDLKTKMIGSPATTDAAAVPGISLGKAIQALDPKADAKAEVNKANQQAKGDMKTAG